ncbi:MAG: flagellar assembly protein FliH [Halieaceae bacterium]|jgi:flagellar assembly protein FliH
MILSEAPPQNAWMPPSLTDPSARKREEPAQEIDYDALREAARREGYETGYAEGAAAARSLGESIAEEMGTLLEAIASPFRDCDVAILRDLVSLAEHAAVAVVHRELHTGSVEIEAAISAAVIALGEVKEPVQISLHPEDAVLWRDHGFDETAIYSLREDASLLRGSVRLRTENSFVDASVDERLREIFQQLREQAGVNPESVP